MSKIRELILNTVEQYYNVSELKLCDGTEEALTSFIYHSQVAVLQAHVVDDMLWCHVNIQEQNKKSIVFYKSSPRDLAKDDALSQINIITLSSSTFESLYFIIKEVYAPLLAPGEDMISSKLHKNLADLKSNLQIASHGVGQNTNVILSIEDELSYWKLTEQKKNSNKQEKEAALAYSEIIDDICKDIRLMQASPLSEMRETVENVGGLLDDLWRLTTVPYPQERMVLIFDIIGHIVCSTVQKLLSLIDIWDVDGVVDSEITLQLSESLKVIHTWTDAYKSLTETYWPNYALHPWNGKPYTSHFCTNFQNRLEEIYEIRATFNQLNKLLTKNERIELKTDMLLNNFKDLNVWMCNGPSEAWEKATAKFSFDLRPAETKVAEKLKPRLHNTSTKQMLYEFLRYKTLMERPVVKRALNSELEIFVTSLMSLLKTIQSEMDSDEFQVKMYQPPEMSTVVQHIQWAKQMEAKVKDVQSCAEKYLSDFEGCNGLVKLATQLLKNLKTMYTQLHDEWLRNLQVETKSGALDLGGNKPVVEFSSASRLMVVKFDPRAVRLQAEARALGALGLSPPPPQAARALQALSDNLKYARILQQMASFHNTLGERMIPSTRPMMLEAALNLSALVQDQKAVYWGDTEQLIGYIDKLKHLVMKLESQNTYLTSQHLLIKSIVEKLMDTELLTKQAEWKKYIKNIRDIIEQVEQNGYKNTEVWRSHWDWQLYKALEYQYVKTLLSLHKHFPHIKVDLVFRGHTVRVQPPMEEIRVQHYHQLRRFIAMPAHFVGLQSTVGQEKNNIFAAIVDKHGWLGNKAVRQVEGTLASLGECAVTWSRRAALACVPDLDSLCAGQLKLPADWELNFKACKAYGQAVAKMTFEDEKIDWISVSTASLRREFEAQSRHLWMCLMSSLQFSCREDAALVDSFVASTKILLDNKVLPKNAKELAELSAKQQILQEKMPEMENTVESLKKKSHLLRTWGGDPTLEATIKGWQKIREMIISQQQMFDHQAEIVKSSINGEWDNLNATVEGWLSRWAQTKAQYSDTSGVTYVDMADRCRSVFESHANWDKYVGDRDSLLEECGKFNMQLGVSAMWDDGEKLISEDVALWIVFKEFNEEYQSLSEQEWIVFQKKIHLLEEFISKWRSRLEPFTYVTLFIQQELDKYSDLPNLLKYLRGTEFTERHWREVFSLLEMENTKHDLLRLKDFLNVANNIKKHIRTLQKINASASSESAVRSALTELELWYASARLQIIYYNDKANQPTPIVKDFKTIMAKVEEQQWVVSSVSGGLEGAGGEACAGWGSRLNAAASILRAAHHAQRRWLYLEPILYNDDGELGGKFRKVDQWFRQVARIFEADPRLSALVYSTRLQSTLDSISEQLLSCQSALNQYIDEKRSIFPRLYFLSNDDLLELLGQARAGAAGRETVMQSHLKKLFPGITGVRLGPGELSITALCTHFDEVFQLDHPVDIDCPVEVWLKNLESEMRSSLKNVTLKCLVATNLQEQDPFSLPTQILCLVQNIRFTERAESAIASKELHKLKANVEKEYSYYVSSEVEDESERNKRQALILQCSYYLSVAQSLIDNNIVSVNDWLWQKQLRFYLLDTKDVVAKIGLAQISYSYEYLGVNTGQFVRTELADECFLILTQSLHLGFVGNPFGPAGTGKTESVKALGGLFGRLVLVFNCDEAMDSECFGRLVCGLAASGSWGCFDEFNRLSADTLAGAAHLLSALLAAGRVGPSGDSTIGQTTLLSGKQVSVNPWCGVVVTMNPAGRGYGGRRRLPAALQRVLRPVAMLRPSARPLAQLLLAARALPDPARLAHDLNTVFTMASTLLSDQRHYDWGLRALKAAVGSCAAALNTGSGTTSTTAITAADARSALRRVLCLNNISKLTQRDAERFQDILSMVFGDDTTADLSSDTINAALETNVTNLGLIRNKLQLQKCTELYEQLQQRMGVVIVGPPGSGKTTIRRLLKAALVQQGKNIMEYVIYPKAMSRTLLLGNIDHDTRQWTDGVISTASLEVSNESSDIWSWVVFDGDIDPEWIEALNSVLDDNRLLTLPSGWRIQFGPNVNFIFETHSLEHASPATISRMGIILLSEDVNCADEILQLWLQTYKCDNETIKIATTVLADVIRKCLQWFHSNKSDLIIQFSFITWVKHILTQFDHAAQSVIAHNTLSTAEEIVLVALQRSVTNIIKENAVRGFNEELSSILGPVNSVRSSSLPTIEVSGMNTWPGVCSQRVTSLAETLRGAAHAHLLVVGVDATAKYAIAEHVLKESNTTVISIDCTPILEPEDIIAELKMNNVVHAGSGEHANNGGRVTLLIRSLDRARVDAWGSSPVQALILQLIQGGGLWCAGEEGAQRCGAARVRVLATAARPALADSRLAAALCLAYLPEPDDNEMLELGKSFLRQNTDKHISDNDISRLASVVLAMFKEVTETFDSKPHYKWYCSHLKQWCENVKWYSPANGDELLMALSAEANIVFRDRLINSEDKSVFNTISRNHLKVHTTEYFRTKLRSDGIYMEPMEKKEWNEVTEKLINQCLTENENNVFSETGIETCSELATLCVAIARTCNGGVCVCVGSAGVGRRAAGRLAAAALGATFHCVLQPQQFDNTIRNAVMSASEGTRSILVICETASDAASLSCVEAMRRARSVHSLPARCLPAHLQLTQQTLHNIKQNLGIVICLDKDQDNLYDLLEKYPILYKDSHLVWIDRWSEDTLKDMPLRVIQRLVKEDVTDGSKEEHTTVPVDGFVQIYKSLGDETMRAPCRYIDFIKSYYRVLGRKKTMLMQRQSILKNGVEALQLARGSVSELETETQRQAAALTHTQAEAARALDLIASTVRADTDKHQHMHTLRNSIRDENEKLQLRKKEIEEELASVEPVIAAARAAVGDIRTESLSEVRSLRAPPDVVRDVLEGVLRLMGIADTSWHSMKNFLSKRGVKEDIRCLDASQISSEAVASVERLLERRGASFEERAARRASAACAPLAAWVRANVHYARALARVRPLQDHQRQLHHNMKQAENQLEAVTTDLASVEARVNSLKEELNSHTRHAAELEMKLTRVTQTLNAARALLSLLAGEYTVWQRDLQHISKEISELTLRSLLAAAYIVYLPDSTDTQASDYMSKWSNHIGFEDTSFSVVNFLSTPEEQLKWDSDGLPADKTALKNAVIISQFLLEADKCGLTPLIVDPEGAALQWLRAIIAGSGDELSLASDKLTTAVQYAARLGRLLMITDVETMQPTWTTPVLGGADSGAAGGGKVRLVLVCPSPPRLPPHLAARLSLLHFTATTDSLTDQLIHYTLQQQNPEINDKLKEIKLQKALLQKQQHELQENLLKELSGKQDILNDEKLVESLKKTRETCSSIESSLEGARGAECEARAAGSMFEAAARRVAVLALAVTRLASKRPLLALPTDVVQYVFVDAVRNQPNMSNVNTDDVVKYVTRRIVERVLMSLHKKDKYTVALHLLKQAYTDIIPEELWQIFVSNTVSDDQNAINDIKNTYPWVPEDCVKKVAQLKNMKSGLFDKLLLQQTELWKQFIHSGDLNVLDQLKLNSFELVTAVAVIRPDSLYRAIVAFIDDVLGGGVMNSAGIEVSSRWGGRTARRSSRPVLLLAPHAADVLAAHAHTLHQVGIGEGRSAWDAAVEATRGGAWLALIVGASPFTHELQVFLDDLARRPAEDFDPEFRLWIVSEDREIPTHISNACVNVILEPPEGVKHNVLSSLSGWGSYSAYEREVRAHVCLALFHATVQERRAYIPQGWSEWYSWEWGELQAGSKMAQVCLSRGGEAGAGVWRSLVAAWYGARVGRRADRVLLSALHRDALGDRAFSHAWQPAGLPQQLPYTKQLQPYLSAFASLPELDSPQLLGLPANCRLAWEKNAANDIVTGLQEYSATVEVNQKIDNMSQLKNILQLWKKLMSGNPLLKSDFQVDKEEAGWWGCVCGSEIADAARATRALHLALATSARAHTNTHAHTQAPPFHKTPEQWQAVWAGPVCPRTYLREFVHRVRASLRARPSPASRLPAEVDLRDLLRPERVVTAMVAVSASLRPAHSHYFQLTFNWDSAARSEVEGVSVVVLGLSLSGAVLADLEEGAGAGLAAAPPTAPPRLPLAPALLRVLPQNEEDGTLGDNLVDIPVYPLAGSEEVVRVRVRAARGYSRHSAVLNAVALYVAPIN